MTGVQTCALPILTPKLFKIREEFEVTHLKILYTRRGSKYNGIRMHGNSYIHSLKGIDLMKPESKNPFVCALLYNQ